MQTNTHSLSQNYFDEMYLQKDDPWDFETSTYERDKYLATIAALPNEKYNSAFEIGCSIGVLTKLLAHKCDKLLAVDIADAPIAKARARLGNAPSVFFKRMSVPGEFPEEQFDLIIMSEVGYFFSMADFMDLQLKIIDHLNPGGQLLLVHWTPAVADFPMTGDQVHDLFMELSGPDKSIKHLFYQRADTYRLDLFEKH